MLILIVDNGKNAQDIAKSIRAPNKIVKPTDKLIGATGIILSDGAASQQKANEKILALATIPVLGTGMGCLFLGASFGAKIKTAVKKEGQERLLMKKPSPLTLEMKKGIVVFESYQHIMEDLPENFHIVASSPKYQYEIIQEMEKPFFGTQFLPEKGGDGRTILANFEKFVEIWGKYHR